MTTKKSPPAKPKGSRKNTMNDQTTIDTTNATPLTGKRTLEEKITATRALLAKYLAEQNAEKQINNVQVGDDITFNFGRADRVRSITGTVQAVADTDLGRVVSVLTGEGIDAELKRVRADAITENRTAASRAPEEAAPVADDADPLNAE